MTTKVVAVDTSALIDGQTANGADTTIPLGDLKLALENALNGLRDYEAVLFERLASDPTAPAAGVAKLYMKNDVSGIARLFMRTSSGIFMNAGFKPLSCLVFHNTTQLISTGAWRDLVFNSESYDGDAMHSTASLTERINILRTGLYLITGHLFISGTTGVRGIAITINGVQGFAQLVNASSPYGTGLEYVTQRPLAAGDYVTLQAYNESGGNLTVSTTPDFGVTFLGDL